MKLCHWLGQSLIKGRTCYKEQFYGIRSHRCLQMTPTVDHCNQACMFCWRHHSMTEMEGEGLDEPAAVLDKCFEGHRKLITGFKGDERCDPKMWKEANEPKHIAISLAGEPTLYPRLGELIAECHRRGMTTFLVTNGTMPKALARLDPLPTQLYLTIAASDEATYKRTCVPRFPRGWALLNETIDMLPSLSDRTRVTIRHTLVKGWNMEDASIPDYAKMDARAEPLFIEPKGYVLVGESRQYLKLENMPSHEEIKTFSNGLMEHLGGGYELAGEQKASRVVCLTKDPKRMRIIL